MLPWVKVHVSVLDNDVYLSISGAARLTFLTSIPLAQKCDRDGELATRLGPLTITQITRYTNLNERRQISALEELVNVGFLSQLPSGAYKVERFTEFQGTSSTERVKAHRDSKKQSCNVTETFQQRSRNALDKEGDKERERDTLGSFVSGLATRSPDGCLCQQQVLAMAWPAELVVEAFIGVFANKKTQAAQAQTLASWLGQIREMRAKGYSWQAIWDAFAKSHGDVNHSPLHGTSGPWANLRASSAPRLGIVPSPLRRIPSRGWVNGEPWSGFRDEEPIGFSDAEPQRDWSKAANS